MTSSSRPASRGKLSVVAPIARIILYVQDLAQVAAFYQEHFGYVAIPSQEPGWQELISDYGGCAIALHRAAKSQKSGAAIKIVFAVADVREFIRNSRISFGPVHEAEGHAFANAKDPAGNSISISSRPTAAPAGTEALV